MQGWGDEGFRECRRRAQYRLSSVPAMVGLFLRFLSPQSPALKRIRGAYLSHVEPDDEKKEGHQQKADSPISDDGRGFDLRNSLRSSRQRGDTSLTAAKGGLRNAFAHRRHQAEIAVERHGDDEEQQDRSDGSESAGFR